MEDEDEQNYESGDLNDPILNFDVKAFTANSKAKKKTYSKKNSKNRKLNKKTKVLNIQPSSTVLDEYFATTTKTGSGSKQDPLASNNRGGGLKSKTESELHLAKNTRGGGFKANEVFETLKVSSKK